MDMGTHIETIILIFRSTRVTLVHFKVNQQTIKFTLKRLDETQRETINSTNKQLFNNGSVFIYKIHTEETGRNTERNY